MAPAAPPGGHHGDKRLSRAGTVSWRQTDLCQGCWTERTQTADGTAHREISIARDSFQDGSERIKALRGAGVRPGEPVYVPGSRRTSRLARQF